MLAPVLLFLLSLTVFNANLRYLGVGDTEPAELLPISIIYEHNLDFNEFVDTTRELPYWFDNINGRIVPRFPIVPGILNLPVYLAAHALGANLYEERFFLSKLSSSIIASLSVAFMYLCLTKVCPKRRTALLFAVVYALATSVWSAASTAIWQHGPSLLFITIALFLVLSKSTRLTPYSGFFLGMAVFTRPPNILVALPLTFYVLLHDRNAFKKFVVLAGIPALLMELYSYAYLGSSTFIGHTGWMAVGSLTSGLPGLLISPSRGLLVFGPIFVFSFGYLAYLPFSKGTEPLYKYLSISLIFLILFYSMSAMWWGGHSFGYRVLTELTPMLVIFLAIGWEKAIASRWYLKTAFVALLLFSVYVQFLGAFYYPCGSNWWPNDIDYNTERLWDFQDTEITRCSAQLLGLGKRIGIGDFGR